jgi:23S rRNA pseudouridine1911/1915/1917 synthase
VPKKLFKIDSPKDVNQRLDLFLAKRVRDVSRSRLQKLIDQKDVRVNGSFKTASYRLKKGDRIEIRLKIPEKKGITPAEISLDILYSDEHLAVIEKPSGLIVHPGAGRSRNTLVHALVFHFPEMKNIGPEGRPGIVHRLDMETSGILVAAKSEMAYKELQKQFKKREIEKKYLGLVRGKVRQQEGSITWAVGRHAKHRERMSIKTRKPRAAETQFRVKKRFRDCTLMDIKPITGRTHQIRVHFSAFGHPVVGDSRYGRSKSKIRCSRLFLHAYWLALVHPHSGRRMEFFSPLPKRLQEFLDLLVSD